MDKKKSSIENKKSFLNKTAYPKKAFNKVYFLYRANENLKPKINTFQNFLFSNPKSYLILPNETKLNYIVGQKIIGPRYDTEDKIIPYSIVGGTEYIQQKMKEMSFSRNNKNIKKEKENNNFSYFLKQGQGEISVSDKDLKEIFNRYKKIIKLNKANNKRLSEEKKFNKKRNLKLQQVKSKDMLLEKKLYLQEKNLENNKNHITQVKKIEKNIQSQLTKHNYLHNKKLHYSNKNIYLPNKTELLMNSASKIHFRQYSKDSVDFTKTRNFRESMINPQQKWTMSLRRPKDFIGERKKLINVDSDINPLWIIEKEKTPDDKEYLMNIEYEKKNETDFNKYKNRMKDFNKKSKESFACYDNMKKLEIRGKDLLKVEENICEKMKGNKKLVKLRFKREDLNDIDIYENYRKRGHSFA